MPHIFFNDVRERQASQSIMARSLTEIRSLARSHTRTAVNVLVGIMRSKDATAAARVSAANAILDRGWGKATQPVGNGDDGALELIQLLIWDKVLGLGTTDPLAGFASTTSNLVVSFYFAKRGFENVARIIKR
jgi:hypothetical protein